MGQKTHPIGIRLGIVKTWDSRWYLKKGYADQLLESDKKIARLDAYGLASVAMDCRVGAMSDTEKNVHCLMPKSIWVASAGKR